MDASKNELKQKHWTVKSLLSRNFISAVAIVGVYTLTGFFPASYLINRYANRSAEEKLMCRLLMEEVRVNPYAGINFLAGSLRKSFDSKRRSRLLQTMSLRIPSDCLQPHSLQTS
jgi:hypothetical protein